MIQCKAPCPRSLPATSGVFSLTTSAREREAALYGIATQLGWVELNPGSWRCPGCARVERRLRQIGAMSS